MYRRMLVPLDGSELAEEVCVYARELAGRLDIDVVLLHVSNPASEALKPMEQAYIEHIAEVFSGQVAEVQKKTSGQQKVAPVKVTGELVVGYAADEILSYADKNSIDLIVLASHGRSGIKRWTVGSIASKVMSATKIPVWLIKSVGTKETPYDQWPSQTLMVLLDGSELAESVLPHAEYLAKQRRAGPVDIALVRIAEPLNIPTYYSPDISGVSLNWGNFIQQETMRRKQAAKEYLAKMEEQLKNKGLTVKTVVLEGRPTDEVVDYANKVPFSMIIMATHGRSGLSRLVYGSVAANVLHGVSRPMFIIKPQ
ncbi:MAG: universal stress protein [Chloroflexi bacterium]|nr:universal stress protein [Chloroflexota bacterium]